MPQDPITLQPGIRARTYSDMVRELMDRAARGIAPAGMTLTDALANLGDAAGFGHRAQMGLVNTSGSEERPVYQPKPGADFDPSGSAFGGSAPIEASSEMISSGPMAARQIVGKLKPMPPASPMVGAGERGIMGTQVGRRSFLKAVPGGALAAKALLSGAEEKVAPTVAEQAAPQVAETAAASQAAPLGASPFRFYERVGNKFILKHEVPYRGEPIENVVPNATKIQEIYHSRPEAGLRPVNTDMDHPEHLMLAEPGSVKGPELDQYFKGVKDMHANPDPVERQRLYEAMRSKPQPITHDPYHARLLENQKSVEGRVQQLREGGLMEPGEWTKEMEGRVPDATSEQLENWKAAVHKTYQPNSYIVEKPIRVRYYQNSVDQYSKAYQDALDKELENDPTLEGSPLSPPHPEVDKLPFETRGKVIHPLSESETEKSMDRGFTDEEYERATGIHPNKGSAHELPLPPKLIGSGDDFNEATRKAHSFLRDIGIDPTTVKWSGGEKIKRATLPNGDVIEIRERPSLRPGYSPEKAGYKNRGTGTPKGGKKK